MERWVGGKPSGLAEQPAVIRVLGNRLLAALPVDCLALLAPDRTEVVLGQGVVCYEPGDPIEQIYFPQTGMISLLVTAGDGATVAVASIGREGAAGLHSGLGGRSSFTRAIVQIGGRFSVISASRFEQAVSRSAALCQLVQRYIETLLAAAQQNAACNAVHDGSSRLCRWLLQCADDIDSEQLPLTQEFLADMLGVRRTTVTLLARELQKKGVLRYSRGRITIVDRRTLEDCACECYEAIKPENLSRRIGVKI